MWLRTCEPDGSISATPEQISRLWRWPADEVAEGIEVLCQVGTLAALEHGFLMVNFAEAQAASSTSTARSRRKRAADSAAVKRKQANKHATQGDAMQRGATNRIEENRKERTTAPPPLQQSTITHRALNAPWAEVREVLEACGRDLDRRTTWPLTEPAGFYEAWRGAGGVEAVSEALRAVCERIKIQHIEAERWHNRMFSPGAWAALMAQLDQCVNADLQRKRRQQAALAVVPEPDKPDIDPEEAARIDAAIDQMFGGAK
jgi:hypothetical protein